MHIIFDHTSHVREGRGSKEIDTWHLHTSNTKGWVGEIQKQHVSARTSLLTHLQITYTPYHLPQDFSHRNLSQEKHVWCERFPWAIATGVPNYNERFGDQLFDLKC